MHQFFYLFNKYYKIFLQEGRHGIHLLYLQIYSDSQGHKVTNGNVSNSRRVGLVVAYTFDPGKALDQKPSCDSYTKPSGSVSTLKAHLNHRSFRPAWLPFIAKFCTLIVFFRIRLMVEWRSFYSVLFFENCRGFVGAVLPLMVKFRYLPESTCFLSLCLTNYFIICGRLAPVSSFFFNF